MCNNIIVLHADQWRRGFPFMWRDIGQWCVDLGRVKLLDEHVFVQILEILGVSGRGKTRQIKW